MPTASTQLQDHAEIRLVDLPQVKYLTSLGRSQLYKLIARGVFPKPIKIGRASRWLVSDVHSWILDQVGRDK